MEISEKSKLEKDNHKVKGDERIDEILHEYKAIIAFNPDHEATNITYNKKSDKYDVSIKTCDEDNHRTLSKDELSDHLKKNNYNKFYDGNSKIIGDKELKKKQHIKNVKKEMEMER